MERYGAEGTTFASVPDKVFPGYDCFAVNDGVSTVLLATRGGRSPLVKFPATRSA
jgi:hypothetical protein